MATNYIITEITTFSNGTDQARLNPTGGELRIEKYIGGAWIYFGGYSEPGNTNNEFRWIVVGDNLQVQQIKDGGSWSGVEGVDFSVVEEYFPI